MRFPEVYIFGAPIESTGPGMVSSLFVKSPSGAHTSRGFDYSTLLLYVLLLYITAICTITQHYCYVYHYSTLMICILLLYITAMCTIKLNYCYVHHYSTLLLCIPFTACMLRSYPPSPLELTHGLISSICPVNYLPYAAVGNE